MEKIMKWISMLFACCTLAFTSCAERTPFQELMGSWVGSSEALLIRSWGQPAEIISEGHTRYLVYQHSGPAKMEQHSQQVKAGPDCTITFESLDEVIVSSKYEGEQCD